MDSLYTPVSDKEIKGKTIACSCYLWQERLVILFTDDTYIIVGYAHEGDSCYLSINESNLGIYDELQLGLITQENYDALVELNRRNLKENELNNKRALFELLKREFGE